mmetsp:Transcript_16684/g.35367  ORF Transcript_16684/g.35367 Transcript_16684/m.35367 type:complete len:297 (+) Transcript_16684:79-969(+)
MVLFLRRLLILHGAGRAGPGCGPLHRRVVPTTALTTPVLASFEAGPSDELLRKRAWHVDAKASARELRVRSAWRAVTRWRLLGAIQGLLLVEPETLRAACPWVLRFLLLESGLRTTLLSHRPQRTQHRDRPHPLVRGPFLLLVGVVRHFSPVPLPQLTQRSRHHRVVGLCCDQRVQDRAVRSEARHERGLVVDEACQRLPQLQVQVCVETALPIEHRSPTDVPTEAAMGFLLQHVRKLLAVVFLKVLEASSVVEPAHSQLRIKLQGVLDIPAHHLRQFLNRCHLAGEHKLSWDPRP